MTKTTPAAPGGATPLRGQRQWPGNAGSTAFAGTGEGLA
jgi:hypothetical protein